MICLLVVKVHNVPCALRLAPPMNNQMKLTNNWPNYYLSKKKKEKKEENDYRNVCETDVCFERFCMCIKHFDACLSIYYYAFLSDRQTDSQ